MCGEMKTSLNVGLVFDSLQTKISWLYYFHTSCPMIKNNIVFYSLSNGIKACTRKI